MVAALPTRATSEGRGAEILWILEELSQGRALRINCGGEEHRGRAGIVWSRDRFFTGGRRIATSVEIASTDDDPLYQSQRSFARGTIRPAGYRVPVPSGRYRVTLHFAEIEVKELELRYFDASLEGERVLPRHIPLRAGFATAAAETFETEVRDGMLDIDFEQRSREPIIAALEIAPVAEAEITKGRDE